MLGILKLALGTVYVTSAYLPKIPVNSLCHFCKLGEKCRRNEAGEPILIPSASVEGWGAAQSRTASSIPPECTPQTGNTV